MEVTRSADDLEDEVRRLRHELATANAALEWFVNHLEERAARNAVAPHDLAAPASELPNHGYFVYVLWADIMPMYVGSSMNVLGRLGAHMQGERRSVVDRITIKQYPDRAQMLAAEYALIGELQPSWNTVGLNGSVAAL